MLIMSHNSFSSYNLHFIIGLQGEFPSILSMLEFGNIFKHIKGHDITINFVRMQIDMMAMRITANAATRDS